MSATAVPTSLQEKQWDNDFYVEYIRESLFADYMGMSENDIIQVKNELGTKPGKTINISLVGAIEGAGTTGDNVLRGNEAPLNLYDDEITIDQLRQAVLIGKMEEKATGIDMRNAGKTMLKIFFMDKLRDLVIQCLCSPALDGTTSISSATEAQKDAWAAANSYRILAGGAVSNYSADHSAMLLNIDASNDDFDTAILSLAKREAKKVVGTSSPIRRAIRPVKTKKGREWFQGFAHSYPFRDFKTSMGTIHQNAGVRGDDNPLFQDGDLVYDGVVVREVPEMPVLTDQGNGGTVDVSPVALCGAQALGLAWGQKFESVVDSTIDYKNFTGIAGSEVRGAKKLFFRENIQHGMLTLYVAAEPDA